MNIHALPPWIDVNAPNGFDLHRSILLTLGYTIDECHAVIKETGPFDECWKELRSEESDNILKTSMKMFKEHWEAHLQWHEKDERERYIHKRKWGKLYQPSKFRPTQLPLGKY